MIAIFQTYFTMLMRSLGYTLLLTLLALIFAMLVGLVFALCNVSRNKALNVIGTVYVDAVRGVPLIVLAFFIYFGVPQGFKMLSNVMMADSMPDFIYFLGEDLSAFKLPALQAGTIALAMNCGAYMAEIFRAGIESIDKGQMEAARSLGLSYGVSMRRVILPQAFKVMIPSIINQFIITLKDTSILSVIGYPELTNMGKTISGNTFRSLETWAIVGILYMIVIITLSKVAKRIERRLKIDNAR